MNKEKFYKLELVISYLMAAFIGCVIGVGMLLLFSLFLLLSLKSP